MGPELIREPAQVAELVDALVSGTSAFTGVEVRVLSWAPSRKIAELFQRIECRCITFRGPVYHFRFLFRSEAGAA